MNEHTHIKPSESDNFVRETAQNLRHAAYIVRSQVIFLTLAEQEGYATELQMLERRLNEITDRMVTSLVVFRKK